MILNLVVTLTNYWHTGISIEEVIATVGDVSSDLRRLDESFDIIKHRHVEEQRVRIPRETTLVTIQLN